MIGTKKYGPRAKGTALQITVLGNGKGMLSWLGVEKRPGHYSIANGQAGKKYRMIHPLITMIAKISREPTQTTTIQWKKEGERENNN
jgi:hypothetical protein